MKILNLYAGIGGNRKLWDEVTDVEVTAVEYDKDIAVEYEQNFPEDDIVITDAHEFLAGNFHLYDFIWASPPCQSHSSFRQNICVRYRGSDPIYPDMKLYQEILLLQHNFKGLWVVENVKPYYSPLIEPCIEIERHLFWSNFDIEEKTFDRPPLRSTNSYKDLQDFFGFNISDSNIPNKRQVLRNCVLPELGKHILMSSLKQQRLNITEVGV